MRRADLQARLAAAKAIGRIAWRLARTGEIFGNIEIEGEEKRIMDFRRGLLAIELAEPFRAGAFETEFSRLRIDCAGDRVFEIRWDKAGSFKVVQFERGERELALPQ